MVPRSASYVVWAACLLTCLLSAGVRADESFSWGISDATVRFAGHDWFVKDSTTVPLQPGPCFWNPANVRSDGTGLRLSVDKAPSGAWMSSEVMIDTSFGYGRYELEVHGALGSHDPNIIFGAFIWDETNGAHYNGEIDIIEASRFGDPFNPFNAQQVIAPWNMDGRINRFALPEDTPYAVLSVDWTASDIVFRVENPDTGFATSWSPADKSIIPRPTGFERLHLNAWQNFGSGPWYGAPVSFTVTSFTFSPSTGASVVVPPKNVSVPLPAPSEGPLNVSAPIPAPFATLAVNLTAATPNITGPTAPNLTGTTEPLAFPPAPAHAPTTSAPTWAPGPSPSPASPNSLPPPAPRPPIVQSLTTLVGSASRISGALSAIGILTALMSLL